MDPISKMNVMPSSQELFKRFKMIWIKESTWVKKQVVLARLIYFETFLADKGCHVLEVNEGMLRRYSLYLLNRRSLSGLLFSASAVVSYLQALKPFYRYLYQEGYLSSDPLKGISFGNWRPYLERQVVARREQLRAKGIIPEDILYQNYLSHIAAFRSPGDSQRRVALALDFLKSYLHSRNKTLSKWSGKDLKELVFYFLQQERAPSLKKKTHTLKHYFGILRVFSSWLYDEGQLETLPLQTFSYKRLEGMLVKGKEQEYSFVKKRIYSIREILRAYSKYLKEAYQHYGDYEKFYTDLKMFIRIVTEEGKTLYAADTTTIQALKKHLLYYEHQPGRFYTARVQSERLTRVKRFYDWFVVNRYTLHHPLKDFSPGNYEKEIQKDCQNRQSRFDGEHRIPSCFLEVFRGVSAFHRTLNQAELTLIAHQRGWRHFFCYLDVMGISDLKEVDEDLLRSYQIYLEQCKNDRGFNLSINTRSRHLIAVKRLFQYLARFKYLSRDPSVCIVLPKGGTPLPTTGLTDRELEKLLTSVEVATNKGLRDRAILEFLYSTGVRSNELCHVKVQEIDFNGGYVRISHPKGGIRYQRIIPIGKTACSWVQKYLNEVRIKLDESGTDILFLSMNGQPLTNYSLRSIVKSYFMRSGLRKKKVVTHSFRVSCATEMLKGKAGIKHVQEQLGHTSIQSTERYLRLIPSDLKKVHNKTHPRERRIKAGEKQRVEKGQELLPFF